MKTKRNYDVRVMSYGTSLNKTIGVIFFYDGLEQLLGEDGIKVKIVRSFRNPNRLYFMPYTEGGKGDYIKLANRKLQFYKQSAVDLCSEFKGEYQLQCDDMGELKGYYYINRDRVSQPSSRNGNFKVPHNNYKRVTTSKSKKKLLDVPMPKKEAAVYKAVTEILENTDIGEPVKEQKIPYVITNYSTNCSVVINLTEQQHKAIDWFLDWACLEDNIAIGTPESMSEDID